MNKAKTIQLFLPNGKPRGVKIAQVTSRIPIAVYVPRGELAEAAERSELSRSGIYFLFGDADDAITPVYVGESENCLERLKQHNSGKEFWNAAVVVVTKTDELTKCQIRYLEWFCCDEVRRIGRGKLLNRAFSQQPYVSEPIRADLMEMFETISLLLSTLDFPIFDSLTPESDAQVMYCSTGSVNASGEKVSDGFVVFRGSTVREELAPSAGKTIRDVRQKLLEAGTLLQEGNALMFTSDYLFPSPSQAAGVVLGRSSNGWTEWKTKDGNTLDQELRVDSEESGPVIHD